MSGGKVFKRCLGVLILILILFATTLSAKARYEANAYYAVGQTGGDHAYWSSYSFGLGADFRQDHVFQFGLELDYRVLKGEEGYGTSFDLLGRSVPNVPIIRQRTIQTLSLWPKMIWAAKSKSVRPFVGFGPSWAFVISDVIDPYDSFGSDKLGGGPRLGAEMGLRFGDRNGLEPYFAFRHAFTIVFDDSYGVILGLRF